MEHLIKAVVSHGIALIIGVIAVVGYLYSTGSSLIWKPKKKA